MSTAHRIKLTSLPLALAFFLLSSSVGTDTRVFLPSGIRAKRSALQPDNSKIYDSVFQPKLATPNVDVGQTENENIQPALNRSNTNLSYAVPVVNSRSVRSNSNESKYVRSSAKPQIGFKARVNSAIRQKPNISFDLNEQINYAFEERLVLDENKNLVHNGQIIISRDTLIEAIKKSTDEKTDKKDADGILSNLPAIISATLGCVIAIWRILLSLGFIGNSNEASQMTTNSMPQTTWMPMTTLMPTTNSQPTKTLMPTTVSIPMTTSPSTVASPLPQAESDISDINPQFLALMLKMIANPEETTRISMSLEANSSR